MLEQVKEEPPVYLMQSGSHISTPICVLLELQPGLYVSRKDKVGSETITTFDLRLTKPNGEPVMNTAEMHTMEHLAATYLRNEPVWKSKVIYFGPMGCRTGFYFLVRSGVISHEQAIELTKQAFDFIASFEGEIPGVSAKECGNYRDRKSVV